MYVTEFCKVLIKSDRRSFVPHVNLRATRPRRCVWLRVPPRPDGRIILARETLQESTDTILRKLSISALGHERINVRDSIHREARNGIVKSRQISQHCEITFGKGLGSNVG
jgi:hypothetical protein